MPLPIVLGLVVGGIALVLIVTHLLGGSTRTALDIDRAGAAFRSEHPRLGPMAIDVDPTGEAAVVWLPDGRIGVVIRLGDHLAVRLVPGDAVQRLDGARICVRFGDVGWPSRILEIADRRSPHV